MPRIRTADVYDFTMGFIASSDRARQPHIDRWQENLANFVVEPIYENYGKRQTPYRHGRIYTSKRNQIILKDPQTHQIIMTYAAKLVRALLGSRDRDYIKAKPRGWEDAPDKAPTVSRLLRYCFSLPGHFRTLVEAVFDMLIFGTSIVEVNWHYEEREMPVRDISTQMGIQTDEFTRMRVETYNDVKLRAHDPVNFYPAPTHYRIEDMPGAAHRFKMNAIQAKAEIAKGLFREQATNHAIGNIDKIRAAQVPESFREGIDQPAPQEPYAEFREMIGYTYWGEVPWEDEKGSSRRKITILNNEVVENRPWPIADEELPYKTLMITPTQGRFWCLGPAEVIRYQQEFADALNVLLAEAIIRQVHPPIAYDPESDIELHKLRAWTADALIAAQGGPKAAGAMQYDARSDVGLTALGWMKGAMEGGSGATEAIKGEPGPSREPATVGLSRLQMAMDRPELGALVLENECLPPIGKSILRRYQQFIQDDEELAMRIGEMPEGAWLGSIMGDFDVEFIGSRMGATRQEKLQAYQTLTGLASVIPTLQAMMPWEEMGRDIAGEILELPEVAARIPDPDVMRRNMAIMLGFGAGRGAGQNNLPNRAEPPGLLPTQAAGGLS